MPIFSALWGIVSFLWGGLTSGGTWAWVAARAALSVGASYLINDALTPSQKDPARGEGFAWGDQTIQQEGAAIAVTYGTQRVQPNIVGSYIDVGTGLVKTKNASRTILACFGEGPWDAEPTDIRVNGRPMSDFADMTGTWRLGTVDQLVITEWATFRQDYHVGVKLYRDEAVTFTLPRTGYSDCEIHLLFPDGLVHWGTDGHKNDNSVTVKVEIRDAITAGAWHTLANTDIAGEVTIPCYARFKASVTYNGGSAFTITTAMQPEWKVTKLSGDPTNPQYLESLEFDNCQVHMNAGFIHPGMVLLSLTSVPEQAIAGGITEISCLTTGKVVSDGVGSYDVSRYHSDAIRDILTQPVIEGDGDATAYSASYYRGLDPDRLIGTGWATQKTLADTSVPAGNGNNVAMLRCDALFAHSMSAHQAVGLIGACGRCTLDYRGRDFALSVDSPRVPVGLLGDGNWQSAVVEPIDPENLASEAKVTYRDVNAAYSDRSILIVDSDLDTLETVDLDLAATTRTDEAARTVRRELARNRLTDYTLNASADIDAIVYEPGDVVYAQIDGRSQGGRLDSVDGNKIVLDRSILRLVTGSDKLIVQHRDSVTGIQSVGIAGVTAVATVDGVTVTVDGTWLDPDGDPWAQSPAADDAFLFGPAAVTDDQFEIVEINLTGELFVSINAVKYVPALDDLDAVAPDVAVDLGALTDLDRFGAMERTTIPGETIEAIGSRAVRFEWGYYTFTDDDPDGGSVSWEKDVDADSNDIGYVNVDNTFYQPADGNTDKRWIYFDSSSPTVFSATDDLADVIGNFLVGENDGGTFRPYNTSDTAYTLAAAYAQGLTTEDANVFNTTMTATNTWQDLDLSATIGAQRCIIFLEATASGGNIYFAIKPKGFGQATPAAHYASMGGSATGYLGGGNNPYLVSLTDNDGVVQIGGSDTTTTVTLKLLSWKP